MTGVSAVFALISQSVKKEVATEGTEHDLVELLLYEFVSIHLVNLALALPDGSLTTKSARGIEGTLPQIGRAHV